MTPEELSDWRKEQRRQRNREKAAESPIKKKRSKILELENEVESFKKVIEEMRCAMVEMQHCISFLNNEAMTWNKNKTGTSPTISGKLHRTTNNDPAMHSSSIVASPPFLLTQTPSFSPSVAILKTTASANKNDKNAGTTYKTASHSNLNDEDESDDEKVIEEITCSMKEMQSRISCLNEAILSNTNDNTGTSTIESSKPLHPNPTAKNDPPMPGTIASPALPPMGNIYEQGLQTQMPSSDIRQRSSIVNNAPPHSIRMSDGSSIDKEAYLATNIADNTTRFNNATTSTATTIVMNKKSISDDGMPTNSAVSRRTAGSCSAIANEEEDGCAVLNYMASNSNFDDDLVVDDDDARYLLDFLEKALGDDIDPLDLLV